MAISRRRLLTMPPELHVFALVLTWGYTSPAARGRAIDSQGQ